MKYKESFRAKHYSFTCVKMLPSHVKRSPLPWQHNTPHLTRKKLVWYFIGVYIIKKHYMAAWSYEISLLVKYFSNTQREILCLLAAISYPPYCTCTICM